MKKKLLSLVLAGAMVASTSVSAFATENKEVTIDPNGTQHKIEMKGIVEDRNGDIPSGTITVTVPTAISFTINQSGDIDAGKIEIVNRNSEKEKVKVVVKQFNDRNPKSGIVLVKDTELDNVSNVDGDGKVHASLKLAGDNDSVQLVSDKETSETGLLTKNGLEINSNTDTSLGEAWSENKLTLSLIGETKSNYQPPEAGKSIKNDFSLLLKIQKVD